MASKKVLQPFKTPSHRYHPGMEIDEADIDGLIPAADWETAGFLGAPDAATAEELAALQEEAASLGLAVEGVPWGPEYLQDAIDAEVIAQAEAVAADEAAEALAATSYTVLEGFVTPDHRFLEGMEISGADINGAVSPEDLVALGILAEA